MQARWFVASIAALGLAAGLVTVKAQDDRHHEGVVKVPDSSLEKTGDEGLRGHTNHVIHLRSTTSQVGCS